MQELNAMKNIRFLSLFLLAALAGAAFAGDQSVETLIRDLGIRESQTASRDMPSKASHAMHSHPNNFQSGIYYVQTHPGANSVNFHDPRPQTGIIRPPVTELTSQNTDQVVLRVNDGMLLMFPSYLAHSVAPNESDKLRISISFNVMFSHYTERQSIQDYGPGLELQLCQGGIPRLTPPELTPWLQSLPPILHKDSQSSV